MMVVILSMAALLVVAVVAMFASRWDKKEPGEEDPDLPSNSDRRSVAATTATLAAMRRRKDH